MFRTYWVNLFEKILLPNQHAGMYKHVTWTKLVDHRILLFWIKRIPANYEKLYKLFQNEAGCCVETCLFLNFSQIDSVCLPAVVCTFRFRKEKFYKSEAPVPINTIFQEEQTILSTVDNLPRCAISNFKIIIWVTNLLCVEVARIYPVYLDWANKTVLKRFPQNFVKTFATPKTRLVMRDDLPDNEAAIHDWCRTLASTDSFTGPKFLSYYSKVWIKKFCRKAIDRIIVFRGEIFVVWGEYSH